MSRIFISYRRSDSEGYTGWLHEHLLKHFDRQDLFMDIDAIRPGQDFVQVLEHEVGQCDVLLAVMGPNWLDTRGENGERRLDQWSDFVRIEIATALKRDIVVIPVLVQGAEIPSSESLPEDLSSLSRRQSFRLNYATFAQDAEKLAQEISYTINQRKLAQFNFARKAPISASALADKQTRLRKVRDDVISFTASPLYEYRTENKYYPVLGAGNADAKIMLVGESPGKQEAETGEPFVGASGEVLNEMLNSINLRREDIYMTNIVKDRLPDNRDPSPYELDQYVSFLDDEIAIIQPEIIGLLGRFAMNYLLQKFNVKEKGQTIGKLHGKLIQVEAVYGEIYLIPLYHPAVALYRPNDKAILLKDFARLKLFI